MNICLINKESHICENIVVVEIIEIAKELFSEFELIEVSESYGIGDKYENGEWSRVDAIEASEPTPTLEERVALNESKIEYLSIMTEVDFDE